MKDMGFIDKVKNIANWESAVVVIVTILGLVCIIIIGAYLGIEILYIGGLIALGIPTSFFGNIATRTTMQMATNSPPETKSKEEVEVEQWIEAINKAIGTLSTEFANLRSQFEVIKMGFDEVNNID